MNTIAAQIDYAAEELAMLNRLLEARAECRMFDEARRDTKAGANRNIANIKYCDALAKVMRLEREYDELYAPA